MRRILIVSPRFPPRNTPDIHRVRTSLPYFKGCGWEPTVLTTTPETCDGVDDPQLFETVAGGVKIVRIPAWSEVSCRKLGFGGLDYRCFFPLLSSGAQLLLKEKFDIVFFSTTAFRTFLLAPFWKAFTRCKVVLDFQDPWWPGDQLKYSREDAPGKWWKYRLSHAMSKYEESFALGVADHVISVSEGYVQALSSRYPFFSKSNFSVIPFGAEPKDYDLALKLKTKHGLFDPEDGSVHWVYVGRGGPDMVPALRALFSAFSELRRELPALYSKVRLHFIGTNYSPAESTCEVVTPVARECGVEDCVREKSVRIPYLSALAAMADSHGVLLLGSNHGDYTASKLFNCICSQRPVLAFFHEKSLVSGILRLFPSVHLASFKSTADEPGFSSVARLGMRWLMEQPRQAEVPIELLRPYTAEYFTAKQCEVFDSLVSSC
jgi:hypothetical protein